MQNRTGGGARHSSVVGSKGPTRKPVSGSQRTPKRKGTAESKKVNNNNNNNSNAAVAARQGNVSPPFSKDTSIIEQAVSKPAIESRGGADPLSPPLTVADSKRASSTLSARRSASLTEMPPLQLTLLQAEEDEGRKDKMHQNRNNNNNTNNTSKDNHIASHSGGHHYVYDSPSRDALPAGASGPVVTEEWARSIIRPGDEHLLYQRTGSHYTRPTATRRQGPTRQIEEQLRRKQVQQMLAKRRSQEVDHFTKGSPFVSSQPRASSSRDPSWVGFSREPSLIYANTVSNSVPPASGLTPREPSINLSVISAYDSAVSGQANVVQPNAGHLRARHTQLFFQKPSYSNPNASPEPLLNTREAEDEAARQRDYEALVSTRQDLISQMTAAKQRGRISTEVYPGRKSAPLRLSSSILNREVPGSGGAQAAPRSPAAPRRRPDIVATADPLKGRDSTVSASLASPTDVVQPVTGNTMEPIMEREEIQVAVDNHNNSSSLLGILDDETARELIFNPFFPLLSEENVVRMELYNEEYMGRIVLADISQNLHEGKLPVALYARPSTSFSAPLYLGSVPRADERGQDAGSAEPYPLSQTRIASTARTDMSMGAARAARPITLKADKRGKKTKPARPGKHTAATTTTPQPQQTSRSYERENKVVTAPVLNAAALETGGQDLVALDVQVSPACTPVRTPRSEGGGFAATTTPKRAPPLAGPAQPPSNSPPRSLSPAPPSPGSSKLIVNAVMPSQKTGPIQPLSTSNIGYNARGTSATSIPRGEGSLNASMNTPPKSRASSSTSSRQGPGIVSSSDAAAERCITQELLRVAHPSEVREQVKPESSVHSHSTSSSSSLVAQEFQEFVRYYRTHLIQEGLLSREGKQLCAAGGAVEGDSTLGNREDASQPSRRRGAPRWSAATQPFITAMARDLRIDPDRGDDCFSETESECATLEGQEEDSVFTAQMEESDLHMQNVQYVLDLFGEAWSARSAFGVSCDAALPCAVQRGEKDHRVAEEGGESPQPSLRVKALETLFSPSPQGQPVMDASRSR